LLHNVETLARVALIARGIEAGRSTLITVWGSDSELAVFDLPLGTTLGDALAMTGVKSDNLRAVLVGGYFGTWLDPAKDLTAVLDKDVPLGAGVIALLDNAHCGVAESSRVLTFLAGESSGQCGPCMFGLPAMARALAEICTGRARPAKLEALKVWASELPGRGACHHPDGASRFTSSALTVFAHEVNVHLQRGRCGSCTAPPLLPVPPTAGVRG
jgi:NADH:ubiquinone oxidoreductase subunit F (NADH-binding)